MKLDSAKFSEYTGRYALKTDLILEIKIESGLLTLRPSFWGSLQILESKETDKFFSLLHPHMKFEFNRDDTGMIVSLTASGHKEIHGAALKLAHDDIQVVEHILSGRVEEALKRLNEPEEKATEDRILDLGSKLVQNRLSQPQMAVEFASAMESNYPNSVDLKHILAFAYLLTNDRENALPTFKRASMIDPENSITKTALRLLDPENTSPPPEDSWILPFDINDLFTEPLPKEIENVLADWQVRDLSVSQNQIVDVHDVILNQVEYDLRIISHEVHGAKHFGAVLIPKGIKSGDSHLLVECHGVDPHYSPFNILEAETPFILGGKGRNTVIAIPSFRGNTLIVNDRSYISEGSPKNAWDGAADDTLAFINAVLDITPEVDQNRISVFGKSRGGTVAMLSGIRDKRIKSIVGWTGPADWFSNMGNLGWTLKELVQWALWERWAPGTGWGSAAQFIDQRLAESIEHGKGFLSEIRQRMIASSPLYFVDQLPAAQLHYGLEDGAVSVSNAKAIQKVIDENGNNKPVVEVFVHEHSGHDMPYPLAYELSRKFLLKSFQ